MGHRWMDIFSRRELVWILIERNLKIRYKSSFLGFFWSLLAPLSLIVVYSVFLGLIRFPMSLPVLVTSIIIWQFLAMCMGDALQSILGNANLVTKAAFPRVILPLSMVGANAINFLFSFAVLSVYLLIARVEFGALIYLPGIMLTQAALCLGMSLIIGTANVFFRDTLGAGSLFRQSHDGHSRGLPRSPVVCARRGGRAGRAVLCRGVGNLFPGLGHFPCRGTSFWR